MLGLIFVLVIRRLLILHVKCTVTCTIIKLSAVIRILTRFSLYVNCQWEYHNSIVRWCKREENCLKAADSLHDSNRFPSATALVIRQSAATILSYHRAQQEDLLWMAALDTCSQRDGQFIIQVTLWSKVSSRVRISWNVLV